MCREACFWNNHIVVEVLHTDSLNGSAWVVVWNPWQFSPPPPPTTTAAATLHNDNAFRSVDDFVPIAIELARKKQMERGEAPHVYKPRAPHPVIEQAPTFTTTETVPLMIPQ